MSVLKSIKVAVCAFSMTSVLALFPVQAFAFDVGFDLNGVAGQIETLSSEDAGGVDSGEVIVPEISVEGFGDGYTLEGWNTERDGSGQSYKVGDKVTKECTLYAQWGNGFMLLVTDTDSLDELVGEAKSIEQGAANDADWNAFQDAIDEANEVLNEDSSDQDDLDDTQMALEDAIEIFNTKKDAAQAEIDRKNNIAMGCTIAGGVCVAMGVVATVWHRVNKFQK